MAISTTAAASASAGAVRRDRFGNAIDPKVGYARGPVITDEVAEARRQRRAHEIIRARYARLGDDGIFNLTGLIRAFPIEAGDHEAMRSYVHFIARSQDELEGLALEKLGGDPKHHEGFLSTRVTAGMLAIMLTLLEPGDRVLSLVADDRSHPSVKQAVELARASFEEVKDLASFEAALATGATPRLVVLTMISPSKKHLPAAIATPAIAAARRAGCLVVLDDAHMAARISLYDEPPGLAHGDPDVVVWSLDKHVAGPRSGFVAGRREYLQRIKARALSLGLEAQLGQVIAGGHAVESFDPAPIRAAGKLSEKILETLKNEMGGMGYLAGAGIAVGGEDYLELAMRKARLNTTELVPIEAVAFASMTILESHGGVMIPAVGMPGSACTFRMMMYPDGTRFGEKRFVEAWHTGLDALAGALGDVEKVRAALTPHNG